MERASIVDDFLGVASYDFDHQWGSNEEFLATTFPSQPYEQAASTPFADLSFNPNEALYPAALLITPSEEERAQGAFYVPPTSILPPVASAATADVSQGEPFQSLYPGEEISQPPDRRKPGGGSKTLPSGKRPFSSIDPDADESGRDSDMDVDESSDGPGKPPSPKRHAGPKLELAHVRKPKDAAERGLDLELPEDYKNNPPDRSDIFGLRFVSSSLADTWVVGSYPSGERYRMLWLWYQTYIRYFRSVRRVFPECMFLQPTGKMKSRALLTDHDGGLEWSGGGRWSLHPKYADTFDDNAALDPIPHHLREYLENGREYAEQARERERARKRPREDEDVDSNDEDADDADPADEPYLLTVIGPAEKRSYATALRKGSGTDFDPVADLLGFEEVVGVLAALVAQGEPRPIDYAWRRHTRYVFCFQREPERDFAFWRNTEVRAALAARYQITAAMCKQMHRWDFVSIDEKALAKLRAENPGRRPSLEEQAQAKTRAREHKLEKFGLPDSLVKAAMRVTADAGQGGKTEWLDAFMYAYFGVQRLETSELGTARIYISHSVADTLAEAEYVPKWAERVLGEEWRSKVRAASSEHGEMRLGNETRVAYRAAAAMRRNGAALHQTFPQ